MTQTKTKSSSQDGEHATDFAAARKAMVDSQLRTSGINEPFVMARMGSYPREDHVPAAQRSAAYIDRAVPLGDGKFLAAPLFHGSVLTEANPTADDRILVVDGGSGYLPALLAPMAGSVDTLTPAEASAKSRKKGDYTMLVIDGAVQEIPESLGKRLADGARIVTGLAKNGVTKLAVGRNSGGTISLLPLSEMGIPHLPEFDLAESWSF